jgi:hypothetical protein
MQLTFITTPNGGWHVHAAGCKDITNRRKYSAYCHSNSWTCEADPETAFQEVYPPDNFCYDPTNESECAPYRSDVRVFPCAKH